MRKSWLGVDCGSVSIKMVLIDENEKLIDSVYLKNHGLIETIKKGLRKMAGDYKVQNVGVTGSGRKFVGMFIGADLIKTEILAHTIGTLNYYPNVKTLMDIGGEDSKLMTLTDSVLENFVLNHSCSAGTGSFLESIAEKMGIKIEDVGKIALRSKQRLEFPSKCLTEENFLLTDTGVKSIKDIKVGEEVLSDKGFRKVTGTFVRNFNGEILKIFRRNSTIPLIVTKEHPIMVIKSKNCKYCKNRIYPCRKNCHYRNKRKCPHFYKDYKVEWAMSDDLREGDIIVCPRRFDLECNIKKPPQFFRLIGYYLAEGWTNHKVRKKVVNGKQYSHIENVISFGFNINEKKYIKDVLRLMEKFFNLNGKIYRKSENGISINYHSKKVANFFRQFGKNAFSKTFPTEWIGLPREYKLELVKGFFRGDGSFSQKKDKKEWRVKIDTTSKDLFEFIYLFMKDLGYIPSKTISGDKLNIPLCIVNGREVIRRHILYSIVLTGNQALKFINEIENIEIRANVKTYIPFMEDSEKVYYPIKKILKEKFSGKVYNLEVEDRHNYIVNDFVCHNCGVFTQSAVVSKKNSGASKEDILMGVCRALVSNYLTMAKGVKLEPPFVYQGATAKNIAIVKAFEENLNHKVIVPEYCDIMGAIGIGLMVKRANLGETNFRGYELSDKNYQIKIRIANGCDNNCEITELFEEGKYIGCIGNKCELCEKKAVITKIN